MGDRMGVGGKSRPHVLKKSFLHFLFMLFFLCFSSCHMGPSFSLWGPFPLCAEPFFLLIGAFFLIMGGPPLTKICEGAHACELIISVVIYVCLTKFLLGLLYYSAH